MLRLKELSLRRGSHLLIDRVSLTIHPGQKIGLVGANGSGKSSLFELIEGHLDADEGELELSAGLAIAHLAQEVVATEQPAIEYVLDGDRPLRSIQKAIQTAEQDEQYVRLGELHGQLDAIDGYSAHSRAEQLLSGLGFERLDFDKALRQFSGGWRIRLNLAQTLMCPSHLLLLDEPTNHLDLNTVIWLERWLKNYQGTLLLVSHDREFLDEVVGAIAHLHQTQIDLYSGNYSQFERLRSAKLAEQQSNYIKQQRQIKHLQNFVRRFRAKASKAKQAQSRIKALERMTLIAPAHIDSPFHFTIADSEKTSSPLLALEQAELGYTDHSVLQDVAVQIQPGNRIGLLGPNGAGKSTLIRSLAGEIGLLSGQRFAGQHLRLGYFSQHQVDDLDLQVTALIHLQRLDRGAPEVKVRSFLGGFGFSGEKALQPVGTFSGGEKARLALAIITWQRPNLLLLDEPTNHLDIEMRQALALALQSYTGAMLLVSHDRYLLRNSVDQFLLVFANEVREFDGDLSDYRSWLDFSPSRPTASSDAPAANTKSENAYDKRKRLRNLQSRLASMENKLSLLHPELNEVELQLADTDLYTSDDQAKLYATQRRHQRLRQEISELEELWVAGSEELEHLQEK
ncbi:MAG: ATP-binding cassette domain-containing protein [Pseudomonadales bacterium]|jgi:ATP-binding cassette subfamily F protein 3|nr:ATP-binding cassette domain-containing protein [Pseudomonadales bacterium]MDP7598025.1 ATP-binding cassette domain-containing protein [Pseudomonadales bacterium]HJN49342.1 ATP-binding cassette domain-containing protein [Pseudomonadales bacterium]|tara:strand:+ start:3882 stop:5759 length:1878 start_codon:yes stop_codon:yes gene_type:complete